MIQTLNFNNVKYLRLPIILKDEAQTCLHLTTPTVDLVEKLQNDLPIWQEKLKKGDTESIKALYDFAAVLISLNIEKVEVDGTKLREVYNLDIVDIITFFGAYIEYIAAIKNSKN